MNLSKALEDDFKTGSYDGSPGATPFDDVFKTEVVRLREFLIPLINELYGESYEIELIDLKREANEHYYVENDAGIKHRISDSCLRIGGKLYHVECQSTVDGNILFRLVEYNMQIGLENAGYDGDGDLRVELPMSSLLMLREGSPGGEKIGHKGIVYCHEGQEIRIEVPVMQVQAYTAEEIYDRKLYMLIPFYSMRYEKTFDMVAKGFLEEKTECDKIYYELTGWFGRLENAYKSGDITEDEGRKLAEISRIIMSHITRKLRREIAERMVNTMGGRVLELQEDRWLAEGRAKGRAEDIEIFITEKRDDKVSDEVIKTKLVKYYKLTEEEAEGYLARDLHS